MRQWGRVGWPTAWRQIRVAAAPPVGTGLTVYNGSTVVPVTAVTVYNGSTWVPGSLDVL